MRTNLCRLAAGCFAVALCLQPDAAHAQNHVVIFGLTNTALGSASLSIDGNNLLVTGQRTSDTQTASSLPPSTTVPPGDLYDYYGVSVNLGEADSGVFFYPYTSYFNGGEFMIGRCYGEVNGQPDELISVMRAVRIEYSAFAVTTDFSPLGASRLTFEVYAAGRLLDRSTGAGETFYIYSEYDPAPRANPFWRLPDGSVAATVELNGLRDIQIPGSTNDYLYGDRVVIRPEQPTAQASFASRLDVTAGGGLTQFSVTDERLGVFQRSHRALGSVVLQAASGRLTVEKPEERLETSGVLIELREERHFSVDLEPIVVETHDSSVTVNVVGSSAGGPMDVLGTAGLRVSSGSREFFGQFTSFNGGLLVCVYQDDCLIGKALSPTPEPVIGVGGAGRLIGVEAAAETGHSPPGLSFRMDGPVAFTLPDGSTLTGNQLHFRAANAQALDRLTHFSLLVISSAPYAFTILGESGRETIHLAEYLPEFTVPASVKQFEGAGDGQFASWTQVVTATNVGGQNFIAAIDEMEERTQFFTFQEDALLFHGDSEAALDLSSEAGLRLLPVKSTLGQTYQGLGSFRWRNTNSGLETPVTVSVSTHVAALEMVTVPAGAFEAVRVEMTTVFEDSVETNAPSLRFATNWLARDVGLIQFAETDVFENGTARHRTGRLTAFNVVDTPAVYPVANVGAGLQLLFRGGGNSAESPPLQWRKDGVPIAGATNDLLALPNVRSGDAGVYSVTVSNSAGALTTDAAVLRVIPFSDTPDTWAATARGGNGYVRSQLVATDSAGNVYVAGIFRGTLAFGTTVLSSTAPVAEFYIAKYDPNGNLLWAQKTGGGRIEWLAGLAVDGTDNVYLTGSFRNSASFGPFMLSAPDRSALFLLKANSGGTFLWAKQFSAETSGAGGVDPWGLAVTAGGEIYVGGSLRGAVAFGANALDSAPYYSSIFMAKLDTSGNALWARQSTGDHYASLGAMTLDENNGVYFGGTFYEQIRFGNFVLDDRPLYGTGFLVRMDADGNFLRAEGLGLSVNNLALAPGGRLYVHGTYWDTLEVGGLLIPPASSLGSYSRAFLAKLNPSGAAEWLLPVGNADGSPGYWQRIAADSVGNLYGSERFDGTRTAGATRFHAPNGSGLVSKYEPGGRRLWIRQIANGNYSVPWALATDPAGNVFVTGIFAGTVSFGDSTHTSPATESLFLVKIGAATAPTIAAQPQSQAVNPGNGATFSVMATGTEPLEYQWRKNGVNIPGATGATYAIAQASPDDAGHYAVAVQNLGGVAVSQSASLQVLVTNPPVFAFSAANFSASETAGLARFEITRSGKTNGAARVSVETVNQSALAGGDYVNTVATLTFADGETSKSIPVPILQDGLYETEETLALRLCRPTGGAVLGTPSVAILAITDDDPPAPVILTQPRSRYVIEGRSATLNVMANGEAPLFYQWRKDGVNIPGATNATYVIASARAGDEGSYNVVVRNAAGEITSASAVLTVRLLPVILQQPQSVSVPYGESVTFSVSAFSRSPARTNRFRVSALGLGELRIPLHLGSRGGTLQLEYDFGAEPDTVTLLDAGHVLRTTGPLAGMGTLTASVRPGPPRLLEIVVNEGAVGDNDGWLLEGEFLASPLGFQWIKDRFPIAGALESTYTIPVARYCDAGDYSVVISDNVGSVTSAEANLLVTPARLRLTVATNAPSQVQALWIAPNHALQTTTNLNAASDPNAWEYLWTFQSGTPIPISGAQQYFRLIYLGTD